MKAREIFEQKRKEWLEQLANYWAYESSWANEELARAKELMAEGRYDGHVCQFTDESFEWSELAEWIAEELFGSEYSLEDLERIEKEIEDIKLIFFQEAADKANEMFAERLKELAHKYGYKVVEHATKCDGKPAWWFYPESWE